ncbi:MAG TPA: hypothetical protein VGN63_23580 [Flavisolibacter sp.]|jgi:hypothetical protein|nr:hypothetical protein [Flavisolibacter sp.]
MKSIFLSCCFFLSLQLVHAQEGFPTAFIGKWSGTLDWYMTGNKEPKKVKMRLAVQPTDTPNVYTWEIRYGEAGEDNRPYLLKPVDTLKGHWQVDERNGILLDHYWLGNQLSVAFTVMNNTIFSTYRREGEALVVEFHSMTAKPVATSGLGTEDSPKVDSYGARFYQRAVLKRIE